MGTQISRGKGKLYMNSVDQLIDTVNYQINEDLATEPTRWWGEFTFYDSVRIGENGTYIIELEDGRRGECRLRKLVNRVMRGVPPRYPYHFTGISALE